jgi:hypothetical protein
MTTITLKDGTPSVVYEYTKDAPGAYVQGVAARDLTDEDLAGYSADQRLRIQLESQREDGAYKKFGTVPKALSHDADGDDVAEHAPATKHGKKE